MRTTLNLNEEIYENAVKATGIEQKTRLIHMGLKELIQKAAYQKLARLGGSFKNAKVAPRRKFS